MKYYIGLFAIVLISILSVLPVELISKNSDNAIDSYRLCIPGIVFSLFILFIQYKNLTIGRICYFFLLLIMGYGLSLLLGFSSWGFAVPFVGGLGGCLVKIISKYDCKFIDTEIKIYFFLGFISSLIGLILFYAAVSSQKDGLGFAAIISSWQIIIGLEYILRIKFQKSILN